MATLGQAAPPDASQPLTPSPETTRRYESYKSFVERATEVFGDDRTASLWLSGPSNDLNGRTPLQAAESLGFDSAEMNRLFIRIEHGIYF